MPGFVERLRTPDGLHNSARPIERKNHRYSTSIFFGKEFDCMNQNHKVRPSLPHVALVVETSTAFGRAILGGIAQYVREYGPWTVYIEQRSL